MPGGISGSCADTIQNCAEYGAKVCTDPQYTQWVQTNCCVYCRNTLGGTGGSGTGTGTYPGGMTGTGTVPGGSGTYPIPGGSGTGGVGTGTSGTGFSGVCANTIANCKDYGVSICTEPSYAQWVQKNCCMFCRSGGTYTALGTATSGTGMTGTGGMTGGTGGTQIIAGGCGDTISNCNMYGAGVCTDPQYDQWAHEKCARTCNKCSSSGTGMTGGQTGSGTYTGTGTITGSGSGGQTGVVGQSSGCAYKGKVYAQGASWRDGCQYNCQCLNGSSGQYRCDPLCYNFNLPPSCQMVAPAQGKCCRTPRCPADVTIQYPAGYVAN